MNLTLIPTWISNHIHHTVWDDITYPFQIIYGATVEVWEWKNNFIPHFIMNKLFIHAGIKVKPRFVSSLHPIKYAHVSAVP